MPGPTETALLTDPVFAMASEQFHQTADLLAIPEDYRDRLLYPKRMVQVSVPLKRDTGRTEVFFGYRVQHHLTLGPTKGGTRYHPSVSLGEVAALAMWMSWKCALNGLPYGGAKGGIALTPATFSKEELERISRRYMQELIPFVGPHTDILGPDMGTNEQVMAWFMDTYSIYCGHAVGEIVTGKPTVLGGSIGRREATGKGVFYLIERAMSLLGIKAAGATAIIQGFGNVGAVVAEHFHRRSEIKTVGISDASTALYHPRGIDIAAALRHVQEHGVLAGFRGAEVIDPSEMLVQPCDILVPAAVDRVIHKRNAAAIRCRILAEAANGPTTPEADAILATRADELFILPDILCNAGGVIVSYFEWVQDLQNFFWTEHEVTDKLHRLLEHSFAAVTKMARDRKCSTRLAATAIGVQKVFEAKTARGLYP